MQTTFQFEAIGTHWQIDIEEHLSATHRRKVLEKIIHRIGVFDQVYSRFRDDSVVAEMAQHAGSYMLPEDAEKLFAVYEKAYRVSDQEVTPLIGQVLVDAGYDSQYTLIPKKLTAPPSWPDVMSYSHPNLLMKQPALLDFGAAGKGYLVDLVGEVLEKEAIDSFCIDAGGDIVYRSVGEKSLQVGLEHPANKQQVIGVVELHNESICGSAGNRRNWGKYHHVMNPKTLQSETTVLATWVVAKTGLVADIVATCLFFAPPEKILTEFQFEYCIVYQDMSCSYSKGLRAEMFS